MVTKRRSISLHRNRLLNISMTILLITSFFVNTGFVGIVSSFHVGSQSKIENSLLNRTFSDEPLDVLISYDTEVSQLKVRSAIALADKSAKILESFEELNLFRVKLVGRAISRLAENEIISGIWSNALREISSLQPLAETSHIAEDYVSPVDMIGAREIWEKGYNGTGSVIAVLDTGIDSLHPDLNKVSAYASFVEADTLPIDIIGHGTYAASIAAGNGNRSDGLYSGIAPGATLLSAKVTLGGLFASPSWIVSGIEWACSRGADIILLPFNTFGAPGDAVTLAVRKAVSKGVFVVAAAGDDGPDYLTIMSPGGSAEAFTVGAYDVQNQEIPDFSGRGPSLEFMTKPDLAAPGVGIVGAKAGAGLADLGFGSFDLSDLGAISGLLGGSLGESFNDDYIIADSTTASAAVAAGAIAILMQAFDRATPIVLANVLRDTATSIGYGANDGGAGLLNLQAAFNYLSERQTPIDPHDRNTGTPLLALGLVSASGYDSSTTMLMSSFGTTVVALDQRADRDPSMHFLMGMFALRWGNRSPTNLMEFDVKRELHQVIMDAGDYSYSRHVGILSYDDSLYLTLIVESYNLTEYSTQSLTAFRITPYILNLGEVPVRNVSLFLSYSLDIFSDNEADYGKYALRNQELFAYGVNQNLDNFYFGMNSSRQLDGFEVGNSSEISSHITDDNLTGSTTFNGSVGLGMKWNFGSIDVGNPVNVTIAMGFAENRTWLDASINAMWELEPSTSGAPENDLIVVEADMPRIAEMGETYESRAVVMNIGWNSSDIIAALVITHEEEDGESLFSRIFSYNKVEPFQAIVMTTEWSPEKMGINAIAWVAAGNIGDAIELPTLTTSLIDLTSILGLLDNFLLRDLFVITPMPSVSVFPKQLPFAPFDLRFPADYGLYTFLLSSTLSLGNLTVTKHGNATDWGNITLSSSKNVEGYYNFSLFLLVPPITVDGYHKCDYSIHTEYGWTSNITLERVLEYPRAMMLMDTSHGGGLSFGDFGSIGGDTGLEMGGDIDFPQTFNLAQDDISSDLSFGDLTDLGSISELMESFRLTTLSGLSVMKRVMAERGLDLVETPGMPLDKDLLVQFSAVFIFSPTKGFNSTEIEILRDFTSNGGKLVVFGDYEDRTNITGLNPLLVEYGYYMEGEHSEENTTEIVQHSILGNGVDCMWLGGGTYILNNQSMAAVSLNGNTVVLHDESPPDLLLFGSSRVFMNKNLVKCNNSIILNNLNEYLLKNTLSGVTSLSENTTRYPVGESVYLNLVVTDYNENRVNDLFVAIVFELPNGTLAFFIAGFVENGLYSSQFTPSYWKTAGIIHGIFIILGEGKYANTYASITFELYKPAQPTTTEPFMPFLTMFEIAIITSVGIFSTVLVTVFLNRQRRRKRMRIPEIDADLMNDIDNALNMLLATFVQLENLIRREDLDHVQKIESLRGMMDRLEEGSKMFEEVSDRIGGV